MSILSNWRGFLYEHALEEDEIQEKTRASKMGVELPGVLEQLEKYVSEEFFKITPEVEKRIYDYADGAIK